MRKPKLLNHLAGLLGAILLAGVSPGCGADLLPEPGPPSEEARQPDSLAGGALSFAQAKRELPGIFRQLRQPATLYCGCSLIFTARGYTVDLDSCGYRVRASEERAGRVEAEHIMPAHRFGGQRRCWSEGGRKNCGVTDSLYQAMEGDLHNLYPAVGEINADRSNFKFARSVRPDFVYGRCGMKIDRRRQIANPPDSARGIVARAYLYMSRRYGIALDPSETNLYNYWNRLYPPGEDECRRSELIAGIQGNANPFVAEKCRGK